MGKYTIESRVTRIEIAEIKATSKSNAIKIAELNDQIKWEKIGPKKRELVSIS